ncbi:MAG: response regulator transcription factor [Chthoniobacterales bacterium]
MNPIRILIADDHAVVPEGTRALLEQEPFWEICGLAHNGREALDLCLRLQPDILILDFNMPDMNGQDVLRELKRQKFPAETLVFSASEAEEIIETLFQGGEKSFIRKSDASAHLMAAIRSLIAQALLHARRLRVALPPSRRTTHEERPAALEHKLSGREHEIVRLVAEGKSNKEAAAHLGMSVRTTETHRAAALRKLQIGSIAELVRYALRHGLVED